MKPAPSLAVDSHVIYMILYDETCLCNDIVFIWPQIERLPAIHRTLVLQLNICGSGWGWSNEWKFMVGRSGNGTMLIRYVKLW